MMLIILSRFLSFLIMLSTASVFIAIAVDFKKYNNKNNTKHGKKSIVATGTMLGFYLVYYIVIRLEIGNLQFSGVIYSMIGTLFVVAGAAINVLGRLKLKDNWANHIKIYDKHTLVTVGVYRVVRHPLYASIMLMLLGGSLAYQNWLSAILTVFVFIPFMYYRAKQEEMLLITEFPEYLQYKHKVGMFFPKIWRVIR